MSRIHERIKPIIALAPKAQPAGGNDNSVFIDGAVGDIIDFVITHGALAVGKTITVTLLNSDAEAGTTPATLGTMTYTAPTGGVTNGILVASVEVRGNYKRYYGVKIANTAAVDLLLSVTALTDVKFTDESIPKSAVLIVQ